MYECLHICLCTICMQCLLSSEESSGTEVSGSRELPSKCWAMNPGPPQGQQVFSTRDSSPASWAHILNKLTAINLWVLINSGNSRQLDFNPHSFCGSTNTDERWAVYSFVAMENVYFVGHGVSHHSPDITFCVSTVHDGLPTISSKLSAVVSH